MPRLHHSDPTGPGIRRLGTSRLRYLDADGRTVTDKQLLDRIAALVIPPAWTDVWISPDEFGHIQALGTDQAGRRQYIYHDAWRARRDRVKFDRAILLAQSLPAARRSVSRDLAGSDFGRSRACAAAFRIIDRSSLRIGNEQYLRSNGSRGLTTLLCQHVTITAADALFTFPSKSGQEWRSVVTDATLVRFLGAIQAARGPRSRLLSWRDPRWHSLTTALVNDDIRERTGGELTAKDFRTLRGTIVAATSLASRDGGEHDADAAITRAIEHTADALGNTRAVAKASYIDPRIFDRYRAGQVLNTRLSPESALLRLLES
jgi:DNA topoisomerase-1